VVLGCKFNYDFLRILFIILFTILRKSFVLKRYTRIFQILICIISKAKLKQSKAEAKQSKAKLKQSKAEAKQS
jgi:dUTPase